MVNRKNRFSPEEIEKFRQLLNRRKQELLALGKGIRDGVLKDISTSRNDDFAHARLHAADQGSSSFDEQLYAGLAEKELRTVNGLDEALARLDKGSYGLCEECGVEIPTPRLEAVPETRLCVDCASAIEEQERNAQKSRKTDELAGYYTPIV